MNNYQYLLQDLERASVRSRMKINPDQKLSLCMIVRNEEKYLAEALQSVQDVVDEMIIVDTGSSDRTVEIAREYGAKVFFYEWDDDFAAARNESLKHASGDWILVMDADERLDQHLKENLRLFLVPTERALRYQVFIRNYMRQGDAGSILGHYMVRLFRKTPDTRFFGIIHEQVFPNTGVVTIPEDALVIWHYGYENVDFKAQKINERNIPLIRKALKQAEEAGQMDLYSFYAFYLGSSLQEPAEAQKWLKIAIDSAPDIESTSHIAVAYLDYLRTFYYLKDFKGGLAAAEEALKNFKQLEKYPDFWDFRGILYLYNQQPDEAIHCFNTVMQLVSTDKEQSIFFVAQNSKTGSWGTLLNLTMAYLLKQDKTQAQYYMKQAMDAYPEADKELLIAEFQKSVRGHTSLLQQYFESKLQEEQQLSLPDIKHLSNIYLQQEKPFEALLLQQQGHGKDKAIDNAFELCRIYESNGRRDLALKTYEAILRMDPNNFKAILQKTILSWLDEGLEAFDNQHFEQLSQFCQSAADWLLLADFCQQVGDLEKMQICLKKILAEEPEHYQAQLRQALLFQLQAQPEQAEALLKQLMERCPNQPEAWVQLGNLFISLQRFVEAEHVFKQHLQLPSPADWYTYYALAIALSAQGRLAEAAAEIHQASLLAPEQPEVKQMLELIQQLQKEQAVS